MPCIKPIANMGKLRQSIALIGELDGVRHNIDGNHTKTISGHRLETYDITTSYTTVEKVTSSARRECLIVNDSVVEIRLRWKGYSSDDYRYAVIPAGTHYELHGPGADNTSSNIYEIGIKTVSGTARVIVHQVWI